MGYPLQMLQVVSQVIHDSVKEKIMKDNAIRIGIVGAGLRQKVVLYYKRVKT